MASASATTGATSESIKAYVDAQTTSEVAEGTNQYFTNARADARITNALIDEDNMASDSATKLPSQQSVKAFVDGEVSTLNTAITTANTGLKAYVDALDRDDDLAFTGDDGTGRTLDLDSGTLTIAGGTGITSASGASSVTLGLDNTAVTAASY